MRPALIPTVIATNADDAPLFFAAALGIPLGMLRVLVRDGHITVRKRGDLWGSLRLSDEAKRRIREHHSPTPPVVPMPPMPPAAVWPAPSPCPVEFEVEGFACELPAGHPGEHRITERAA